MGQQTIPVLKEKFADGKTPTGGDFGDVFDSYIHKSTKINQSQVLGLNEDFATKNELANVTTKFKGYHTNLAKLQNQYPQAQNKKDFFAWVGSPYPGTVYKVYADKGAWTDTGEVPTQQEIDLAEYAKKKDLDEKANQSDVVKLETFSINAYTTTDNVRFEESRIFIKKEGISVVNNKTGNQHNIIGDTDLSIDFSDMLPSIARRYVYIDGSKLIETTAKFGDVLIISDEKPINNNSYIMFAYGYRNIVHPTPFTLTIFSRYLYKYFNPNKYSVDFGNTGSTDTFEIASGDSYDTLTTPEKGVIITLAGNQLNALKNLSIAPLDINNNVQYRYYVYIDINKLVSGSDNKEAIIKSVMPVFKENVILFAYFFQGRYQYVGEFWGKLIGDRVNRIEKKPYFDSDFVVAFREEDEILDFTNNQVRIKRSSLPYIYQKQATSFINKIPAETTYIEFNSLLSQGHNRTFLEINLEVLQKNKVGISTDMDTNGLFVLHGGSAYNNKKYAVLAMWYYDKLMPIGAFGNYILKFHNQQTNSDVLFKQLSKIEYLKRNPVTQKNDLLTILHISDIHNDSTRMQFAIDCLNKYNIDFALCSGDIVHNQFTDPFGIKELMLKSEKKIYTSIGNHEVYVPTGEAINGGNNTDVYNKYIQPFESKWGINTNGKCYYSFDVADKKIRIITLYQYEADKLSDDGKSYKGSRVAYYLSQEQINWFIQTLNTTPDDYGVMIMCHDKPYIIAKKDDDTWCDRYVTSIFSDKTDTQWGNILPAIVEAWIKRELINWEFTIAATWLGYSNTINVYADFSVRKNSKFIGWVFGHTHSDYISTVEGYDNQKTFQVAAGICYSASNTGDLYRNVNDYSQHCFNILFLDLSKTKLLRVGAYLSADCKERKLILM